MTQNIYIIYTDLLRCKAFSTSYANLRKTPTEQSYHFCTRKEYEKFSRQITAMFGKSGGLCSDAKLVCWQQCHECAHIQNMAPLRSFSHTPFHGLPPLSSHTRTAHLIHSLHTLMHVCQHVTKRSSQQ